MNSTKNDQSEWTDCQPGDVGRLVNQMRSTSRRQQVRELAIITTASLLFVAAGLAWYGVGVGAEPTYGGIACSEVMEFAREFVMGELGPEQAARVKEHLVHCKDCAAKIHKMQQKDSSPIPEEAFREKATFDRSLANHRPLNSFELALATSY